MMGFSRRGVPRRERQHVVECFARAGADTILYEFTVEDPVTWRRPWSVTLRLRRTQDMIVESAQSSE